MDVSVCIGYSVGYIFEQRRGMSLSRFRNLVCDGDVEFTLLGVSRTSLPLPCDVLTLL